MMFYRFTTFVLGALLIASISAGDAVGQTRPFTQNKGSKTSGLSPDFGSFGRNQATGRVTLFAEFEADPQTGFGLVTITAEIDKGFHIYSQTNRKITTDLKLVDNPAIETAGVFRASIPSHLRFDDILETFSDEFEDLAIWELPIKFKPGVNPADVKLEVQASGQICRGNCSDFDETAVAEFAGEIDLSKYLIPKATKVENNGKLIFKAEIKIDEQTRQGWVIARASIPAGYHLYSQRNTSGTIPLSFEWPSSPAIAVRGNFAPVVAPHIFFNEDFEAFEESFSDRAAWIAPIKLADETDPKSVTLNFNVIAQYCRESQCIPFEEPLTAAFSGFSSEEEIVAMAEELVGPESVAAAIQQQAAKTKKLDLKNLKPEGVNTNQYSFGVILLFALLGGFVLNFMPCVLPVIGLKIMSFVNQAGQSRSQAFILNLWYVGGMLSVFMILATLAVVFNLGWGQQSQFAGFNITMAAVVFVMGLSFLGIWEIPIPGFVGSSKIADASQKEGKSAAFLKGIVTTVLAVPCSGPGLATAMAYSAGKPPLIVYTIFLFLGLGMAIPYIVIGLKPELIRFLPKPGAWMDTFKQVMGFFLLGTVLFIMSYIPWELQLATWTFLFVLWFCCWMIGRMPYDVSLHTKVRTWLIAATVAIALGAFSFTYIRDSAEFRFERDVDRALSLRTDELDADEELLRKIKSEKVDAAELDWHAFSVERLQNETAESATVLVDFTADW